MRCKICKLKFEAKYFNQKTCFNPTCIIEFSNQEKERTWRKKKAEIKKVLYPKKNKALLQNEINKLARMIDAKFGYLCIDCGKPYGKQIDACHFHNKSTHGEVTYNLHNLHSGRSNCNQYSSEHKKGYYKGLIERYGQEYADFVNEGLSKPVGGKLMENDIIEKLKVVRATIRNFESFDFKDGLDARNQLNLEIGIHLDEFIK